MKAASTVTEVCRIIGEFADRKSLGVTDLAKRTDLLPSDVHRILTSLKATGYIVQDPETKKYQLGFALVRLGLAACQRNKLYKGPTRYWSGFRNRSKPPRTLGFSTAGKCRFT